jgi:hypothetical protein
MRQQDTHDADAAWISEEDARKLLARAAELDAHGPVSIRLAQLRASASEAGISHEAFSRALVDLRAGNLEPRTVGRAVASRLARYRRPAFALAYLAAAFITPGDFILPTVILTLALFGAYEGFLLLARWFGRQPGPPRPPAIEVGNPAATPARTPREKSDLQMRLLVLRDASGPAA